MEWASGSHLRGSLADLEIGDAAEEHFKEVVAAEGLSRDGRPAHRGSQQSFGLHRLIDRSLLVSVG